MSIVYEAYGKYLRYKREQKDLEYAKRKRSKGWTKGTLWPSDVGRCQRQSLLRVTGVQSQYKIETRGLDYMNTGIITEDETLEALKHVYKDRLTDQVELKYQMWSGKADFGVDIGTENPIIIEHKTTSEKHFDTDSKTELPKHEHMGQAMTYMYLYEQIWGITPKVYLFYKSWGCFAEFELTKQDTDILISSYVNGVLNIKTYKHDFYAEIREFMLWYDSTELPPKQKKKYKFCQFMGKPSCRYYDDCWGE